MEPAESAWPKKNAEKESSEWFLNNAIGVKTKILKLMISDK